jgi:signal transduction histidine kinase
MSTDSAGVRRETRRTWPILLVGFAMVGSLFVAQDLITRYLSASNELLSQRLELNSFYSIDEVNRIARDELQVELLVDEHIHETDPARMAGIEKNIDALLLDIDQASRVYEPLIEFPDEASEWAKARASLASLRTTAGVVLELSRQNLDGEARARLNTSRAAYADLSRTLAKLIELNRQSALSATAEIAAAQRRTREINDAIRLLGLIGVGLLALWVIRRVLGYERQLQESAERLAIQNHDLDAFAGRVAHDLKNALGPLLMFPALLRRDAADPQRVRELAQSTERSTRRTSQIIDSLLALARASQNVDPNAAAPVRDAVESVLEETAQLASQLAATIEVAAIPDVVVRCELGLLHVVLANLVGNAVKYLAGRPVRRVQIRVSRDDGACRFEIADTGPGIPKDQLQKIFEPFYRVDAARGAGSGIGLATVRRILDARSGRIAVESEEGQGTRFVVWLPFATAEVVHRDQPRVDLPWRDPASGAGVRHVH